MMLKRILIINIAAMLLGFFQLHGVKVRKISVDSFESYQKGTFRGTLVNSDGQLSLGRDTRGIKGPLVEYYLSVAAKGNDIFVGTGHRAEVYRLGSLEGKSSLVTSFDESDVYALEVSSTGVIYAGTSPNGKVYKIGTDGKKKLFFDPQEKFIWGLKEDRYGNIICVTGNNGVVYKITPAGKASRLFVSEDSHLISLFISSDNRILVGSGDKGVLYSIDNNKIKVLHDSSFEEVRGICEDSEGNIFVGSTRSISAFNSKKLKEEPLFGKKDFRKLKNVNEKAAVYRVAKNGIVEKVWKSEKEYLYDIAYDKGTDKVVVGTGNSGRVYSIDKDGTFDQIYENDSAQVYKLLPHNSSIVQIGNNTSSINIIDKKVKNRGTYFSEIFDLGVKSNIGHIYWESKRGTAVLYMRTGNSSKPDKTWSEWSPPFSDPSNSNARIKGRRYAQVKVVLNSSNISVKPALAGFSFYYLQANLRPVISRVEINPKPKMIPVYPVIKTVVGVNKPVNNGIGIVWEAQDFNEDPLNYTIYLKKKGKKRWMLIKKDIKRKSYTINPDLYDDGIYSLKLVADDSSVNPGNMVKRQSKESRFFVIDSTAPLMNNYSFQSGRVKFTASDLTSIVKEVNYSFDGNKWFILFPVDGICDSSKESFDFSVPSKYRNRTIFIKIKDGEKNFKVFQRQI